MSNEYVCPAEHSGFLDFKLRRLFQNPEKILKPYITKNMEVLDIGCGPGFFTIDMAELVEKSGKVIAADLQEEMLLKLKNKIKNTNFQEIIQLHKVQKDKIGLSQKFDFILVFYMLHEVPNQKTFLKELKTLLNPNGKILISEPKFHVQKKDFEQSIQLINSSGFKIVEEPKIFMSRSILITSDNNE